MTVAEAVADWLAEKEIAYAFGVIGAGNLALWDAITRKGATQIVCTHHEQAAVMCASFYQRTNGRISVALVTAGAGSTNAITGVMAAFMDSTPLIVISGNETSASLNADTRVRGAQGYESSKLAIEFCADAWRIDGPEELFLLESAFKVAMFPRQGPCWIDIPRDVQVETL